MSIKERQKYQRSLDRLVAQRFLYRRVQGVENGRLALIAISVTLAALDIGIGAVWFSHFAVMAVIFFWFLDQAILVGLASAMKEEAATIQEDFDCFVLKIPWPAHRGVKRPTEDRIRELSARAAGIDTVTGGLEDWYGSDGIPEEPIAARIHCQRTNCRWDERLRREWILSLTISSAFVLTIIVFVMAISGVSVLELVMVVAAGLRVLAWLVTEFNSQSTARKRMGDLHRYLSIEGRKRQISMCDVRLIQDVVFEHRRSCPTIPDWFYRLRKKPHEELERTR